MLDQLNSLKGKHPSIGDVRGIGLLIGVELVLNRKQKKAAEDLAPVPHQ
jgi:4-aminobutyrate aminotransferase-like enzyme